MNPYDPRAAQRLGDSLTHLWDVRVYPAIGGGVKPLEVATATVTFDETWTPHAQASLTCRIPDDPATLAMLDPRLAPRISISAGYAYTDADNDDTHPLCNLELSRRSVRRPQNDLTLTAMSDEIRMLEAAWYGATPSLGNNVYNVEQMLSLLINAGIGGYAVQSTVGDLGRTVTPWDKTEWFPQTTLASTSFWQVAAAIADAYGVWLYSAGDRTFRITKRPTIASSAVMQLRTGPAGSITSSESNLSREDGWANAINLIHTWRNEAGTPFRQATRRYVNTGPYSVAAVGSRTITIERDTPITRPAILQAATGLLTRALTRGRGYRLTAPAAYWLRPGDTVTVQLPTGGQERHLVAAVTFSYPDGLMTVTTRLPENVTTQGAD